MNIEDFRRLFRYEHWANQETLLFLQAANEVSTHSIALLAHILGTESSFHYLFSWAATFVLLTSS